MLRSRLMNVLKNVSCKRALVSARRGLPVSLALVGAYCEQTHMNVAYDDATLGHEFLIRQASTVNVNAATQLLTVTLVAIQDTSERLRDTLTQEICLVRQALEWGEGGTPPHHWDKLVAVRGTLDDLRHNLRTLFSYMEYAEKLATVTAEISYLSGNVAASDAICERIDHACRACNSQKALTGQLQQESLELQRTAIVTSPRLEDLLKEKPSPAQLEDQLEEKPGPADTRHESAG